MDREQLENVRMKSELKLNREEQNEVQYSDGIRVRVSTQSLERVTYFSNFKL